MLLNFLAQALHANIKITGIMEIEVKIQLGLSRLFDYQPSSESKLVIC